LPWQDPELDLWLGAQQWLRTVARQSARHLDIGCGFGRITLKFGWLFDLTTCLEADAVHMKHAQKNILNMSRHTLRFDRPQSVEYVQNRFLDVDVGVSRYNAITCVHVIQHISTVELPLWLRSAHRALVPGGIFVLRPHTRMILGLQLRACRSPWSDSTGVLLERMFTGGVRAGWQFGHMLTKSWCPSLRLRASLFWSMASSIMTRRGDQPISGLHSQKNRSQILRFPYPSQRGFGKCSTQSLSCLRCNI